MKERRRWGAALVLAGGLLLAIGLARLATGPVEPELGPFEVRSIYPEGTPTPDGYEPGIYLVRELFSRGAKTITPVPGVAGVHIDIYWEDVQATAGGAINWAPVATQIAYADSIGYKSCLSIQFYENKYGGLDVHHLPSGVPTVNYTVYSTLPTPGVTPAVCSTEVAPDYGAAGMRNAYATVVPSLMSEYGSDPRVACFVIQMGVGGEAQDVQPDECAYKKYYFETQVPCQEYLDLVVDAAHWHRAGTNKPVFLASGIGACYQSSYNADYKASKYFLEKINRVPTTGVNQYIGYRNNGLAPDLSSAMFNTPTPGPFGRMQPGYSHPDQGGIAFEPGSFPTVYPTADVYGVADYSVLAGAAANADHLFLQDEWLAYIAPNVLDVITQTLGTTADNSPLAWLWFRESEFKRNVNGLGYSYSGVPGPYAHLASIVGSATPTTYCSSNVRATSVAFGGSSPPDSCYSILSNNAPEARNALGYNSGTIVGIDVDDGWQYAGNVNRTYNVDLRYLDNNAAQVVVAWEDTGGTESTRTIVKGSTGGWVTSSFTMTAALKNGMTSGADLELRFSDAQTILNSLVIEYEAVVSTPTPTPTPTQTFTPAPTNTPGTPVPTNTPAWISQACRKLLPTIDGDLGEWAALATVGLSPEGYGYAAGAPVSSGLKVHVFAVVPEAVMPPLRPMCSGQRISSALSSVSHVQRVPLRMATPSSSRAISAS